jgi:DNA-3-methyladenine glycosylase
VQIAKSLLDKLLITNINGKYTSGILVETDAYAGIMYKVSHAYGNRRTARNETMYQQGCISYIYLCFGIHYIFNVVINHLGQPSTILVRANEPIDSINVMLKRLGLMNVSPKQ